LAFFHTLGQDACTSEAWLLRYKSSVYLGTLDPTRVAFCRGAPSYLARTTDQDSARLISEFY
jgi:hypothetical protein